jgi:hypothetical protein
MRRVGPRRRRTGASVALTPFTPIYWDARPIILQWPRFVQGVSTVAYW